MPSSTEGSTGVAAGQNGLLAGVPLDELEQLRPHLEAMTLEPKRFFLPAEQPLSHVYFPSTGMTSLMVSVRSGQTVQVAAVGREGMLGVSVVLEANHPPYEMLCQVRGEALRMPAGQFASLAHELPAFRRLLLRYALGLLHETALTAACNGLHSVEQRLARWLLHCCNRVGANTFPITHESLAHMLGVGRPFVTQTVAGLEDAGLIQHQRGVVRIVDRVGLEAVACDDYQTVQSEYNRLLA